MKLGTSRARRSCAVCAVRNACASIGAFRPAAHEAAAGPRRYTSTALDSAPSSPLGWRACAHVSLLTVVLNDGACRRHTCALRTLGARCWILTTSRTERNVSKSRWLSPLCGWHGPRLAGVGAWVEAHRSLCRRCRRLVSFFLADPLSSLTVSSSPDQCGCRSVAASYKALAARRR